MNKYIISSRHTVETFPQVFFMHNAQDCSGITADKHDKDTANQVHQHDSFMPIIFVTIQIIYYVILEHLGLQPTYITHCSPRLHISFPWAALIQWNHLEPQGHRSTVQGKCQNTIPPSQSEADTHPLCHDSCSFKTSSMRDH